MTDLIWIRTPELAAAINPHGAELTHLHDADGAELMTDADPAFWPKHAPVLFPVIGVTNGGVIRLDGQEYPMPKHGFARDLPFTMVEQGDSHVVFGLADSEHTRRFYPFAFRLEIAFRLEAATLTLAVRIANPGETALPAQFGFHPAFAWPLPYGHDRADHRIVFAADEPGAVKQIAPDGTIAATEAPSPVDGREMVLRDELFMPDALVWDPIHSQALSYGASAGPSLAIAFPDTPRLGIWTKPGAHFVCVEPWHGIADPHGFTGDFHDKPGVFEIAAGEAKEITMSVTLRR